MNTDIYVYYIQSYVQLNIKHTKTHSLDLDMSYSVFRRVRKIVKSNH